jgi:hypothetical protein
VATWAERQELVRKPAFDALGQRFAGGVDGALINPSQGVNER